MLGIDQNRNPICQWQKVTARWHGKACQDHPFPLPPRSVVKPHDICPAPRWSKWLQQELAPDLMSVWGPEFEIQGCQAILATRPLRVVQSRSDNQIHQLLAWKLHLLSQPIGDHGRLLVVVRHQGTH
jgi:hypothetical protein